MGAKVAPTLGELLDEDWAALNRLAGTGGRRRFRHCFSPRFAPVTLIRVASSMHKSGWPRISKLFSLANFLLFGIEVPARLTIGPGLVVAHTQGTVLGGRAIGSNVTIFHQVTLGATLADFNYTPSLRPLIEDNVMLCAGAKILGGITVGHDSVVGANAVVLDNVAPNSLAVGVPARCMPKKASDPQ